MLKWTLKVNKQGSNFKKAVKEIKSDVIQSVKEVREDLVKSVKKTTSKIKTSFNSQPESFPTSFKESIKSTDYTSLMPQGSYSPIKRLPNTLIEARESVEAMPIPIDDDQIQQALSNLPPLTVYQYSENPEDIAIWKEMTQDINEGREELIRWEQVRGETRRAALNGGLEIIYTPSGKVYLKTGTLGKGNFKTTSKILLVASIYVEHLQKAHYERSKAYVPTALQGDAEAAILTHLNEIKKKLKDGQIDPTQYPGLTHIVNVKSVKEVVNISDGQFSNMEKYAIYGVCNGGNVDAALIKGTLSHQEKDLLMGQLASGVATLHKLGIIHRDLNSGNAVLEKTDDGQVTNALN